MTSFQGVGVLYVVLLIAGLVLIQKRVQFLGGVCFFVSTAVAIALLGDFVRVTEHLRMHLTLPQIWAVVGTIIVIGGSYLIAWLSVAEKLPKDGFLGKKLQEILKSGCLCLFGMFVAQTSMLFVQ